MCEWCIWIFQNWLNCVLCLPVFRCIYRQLYKLLMKIIRKMKSFVDCLLCRSFGPNYSQLEDSDSDVELGIVNRRDVNEIHADIETNVQIQQKETEIKFLQSENDRLQNENSSIKAEKDEAIRRLSEVMSSKLRDNNPNIVDLSDEFRPTKLAEMSSELYDNEWTEAFTFLEKEFDMRPDWAGDDEKIINILLGIFMEINEVCKAKHEKEWKDVVTLIVGSTETAGKEDLKYLKDLRKKYANDRLEETQMVCLEKLQHSTQIDQRFFQNASMFNYIKGCVKLSWFSRFQDPPIVFLFPKLRGMAGMSHDRVNLPTALKNGDFSALDSKLNQNDGSTTVNFIDENEALELTGMGGSGLESHEVIKFDKNLYKEYTKSGQKIDYVVWPVMLLHENGSILSKGVAQGCD